MINVFQLNDLDIKSFLKIILAVQLALWCLIGLDAICFQIPILRQLIGFIYLTFVPGILILRILKLHKLSNIETLLYTVGLSIATLMFTGLFINTVYPLFGISGPISTTSLVITISVIVLVLCVISYVRDKDFAEQSFIDIKDVLSPPVLFLCLILFLAIFGTYLVDFYHNNLLIMVLMVVIALVAFLIGFDKFIPKKLYPLAVFMVVIALLYKQSLIGMYLPGWDIHQEYNLANLVNIKSLWDPTIPSIVNAMLSITMLAPIYSMFLNMDLTWVFKVIYPLLYSFRTLGLYHVFQKQTDDKIAFLSCFFLSIFSPGMVTLARQEIAELFLVLLMLLMIDKNINTIKRSLLFIVFGISMVVSHYGLSYIFMFTLITAWIILVLIDAPAIQRLRDNFHAKFSRYKREKLAGNPISLNTEDRKISSTFVLLFVVFALTWYMYVSSSSVFNAIVHIGDHIASSIFTDFLNPEATQGLSILLSETISPLHEVSKFLHHITQFFIVVGIFKLVLRGRGMKFQDEYAVFSVLNLMLLLACITVPHFSGALNTSRFYRITLIFLAPFCVIGGVTVFRSVSKAFKCISHKFFNITDIAKNNHANLQTSLKLLSIFFVIFCLFNTGFIYTITGELVYPLSVNRMAKTNEITMLDKERTYKCDAFSAEWLSTNIKSKDRIYAGYIANEMVLISYGMQPRAYWHAHELSNTSGYICKKSYIYLRRTNVIKGVIIGEGTPIGRGGVIICRENIWNTTDVLPPSDRIDVIYTNGGSEIYYYE